MKIGIFTFHCAANYGAVLQTYCLQEVLKSMGHEVYVIDYRPKYLIDPYKIFSYDSASFNSFFSKCKGLIRACLVAPIRWKRNRVFARFIHDYINLYQLDLNDASNDFDAFVFGSDQIWNPKLTNGFDKVYLGDFPAAKGKKLIAYAASAGSLSNFSSENVDYFLSRLKCFDRVLVREKSLADYINKHIFIKSDVVYDPVMLGGISIIKTLFSSVHRGKTKIPYLLLFQLHRDNQIAKCSIDFAKEKNLNMVELATMAESLFNKNMKQILSINKLLFYFKNSSYIITTSYHGTILSILFNKQFNIISAIGNKDERFLSLLKDLNLLDRMLNINENLSIKIVDYDIVNNLYDKKKIESRNILYYSLCH